MAGILLGSEQNQGGMRGLPAVSPARQLALAPDVSRFFTTSLYLFLELGGSGTNHKIIKLQSKFLNSSC